MISFSKQKEYARKIQPIRKNGHLLLITLILANMIVNETLPVIFDPLLGGPLGVVASTALIVMYVYDVSSQHPNVTDLGGSFEASPRSSPNPFVPVMDWL